MGVNSCSCTTFGGRYRLYAMLSVFMWTVDFAQSGIITGDPPSFTSTTEPQDQFVFEVDADGNPVTLTFLCPVTGSGPPNITWYRSGVEDDVFVTEDGSYVFPNITKADEKYANATGVVYYCTATNDFGTIRSPNVRAFYASFAGFVGGTEEEVDVIESVIGNLQWVSLECAINSGSIPEPEIVWVRRDSGGTETILMDDTSGNTVRYIDSGQYLILETDNAAITDKEYFCKVTNKDQFQTESSPITYTLNGVSVFDENMYPNGVRVYKPLTNKTAPRVALDAIDPVVVFGTGVAYDGTGGSERPFLFYDWKLDDGLDGRLTSGGPVASVIPRFSDVDDDDHHLKVQLTVFPTPPEPMDLVAYLLLLDPPVIDSHPSDQRDVLTGDTQTFKCTVSGSPRPTVTWYFNGDEQEGDSDDRNKLTISPTAVEHSGMYQCFADNENGFTSASWTLQVREPVAPDIKSTSVGSDILGTSFGGDEECLGYPLIQQDDPPVVLTVTVTADPCPQVEWFVSATLDSSAKSPPNSSLTNTTGSCDGYEVGDTEFTFKLSVNELSRNTYYSASFTNEGGTVSVGPARVTGRLRALVTDLRSEPNSPIPDTDSGCLLAEDNVEIVCENVALPIGRVDFFKDGNIVNTTTNDRVTQMCDTLKIMGVKRSDAGSYICRVHNDDRDPQAEDTSSALSLEYCTAPAIVGDLTFSKNNPEEDEGTTATCEWSGDPKPLITWLKDGEILNEAELPSHIRIVTRDLTNGNQLSELQIQSVEPGDAGEYTCNVSNPVGFKFKMRRLEVQAIDELPLSQVAIIGISAGGAGFIVLLAVVIVLLCCVYQCAKRSHGEYTVPMSKNDMPMSAMGGPETFNVDAPDGLEEELEAFNPDYASLPALRPAQPPQYKPTPHYSTDMPPEDFTKLPPSEDDFVGPYHDNGGMHPGYLQSTVDDFVSDDAQFV